MTRTTTKRWDHVYSKEGHSSIVVVRYYRGGLHHSSDSIFSYRSSPHLKNTHSREIRYIANVLLSFVLVLVLERTILLPNLYCPEGNSHRFDDEESWFGSEVGIVMKVRTYCGLGIVVAVVAG